MPVYIGTSITTFGLPKNRSGDGIPRVWILLYMGTVWREVTTFTTAWCSLGQMAMSKTLQALEIMGCGNVQHLY